MILKRKRTTAEFIAEAKVAHSDKFDYSLVSYTNKDDKIKIICPVHGMFEQIANNHLRGSGCRKCSKNMIDTTENFIARATAVHGASFDYTDTIFINGCDIKIKCNTCNEQSLQPAWNHLSGQGCGFCAGKYNTTESFVKEAQKVHEMAYSYFNVNYVKSHQKVFITCPVHGDFDQTPSSHLSGRGCPNCKNSGYRVNLNGYIYVMHFDGKTKIGITNRHPEIRATEISRSCGKNVTVISYLKFQDGNIPRKIEKEILSHLRNSYSQPIEIFDGSTETFVTDDVQLVTQLIMKSVLNSDYELYIRK